MPRSKKKRADVGAKFSVFGSFLRPYCAIQQKYPNMEKHHGVSELIILGRVWKKVSSQDNEGWCLEVSHEDVDDYLFFEHRIVLVDVEVDEERIFKTA